ncbi:MAG: response regulator [Alphaproteobacteria bacterium]|jgi:DNA-binding NarL/FixJ family response regulator|nr:response regulator [Alphaproteobacteria bacterium]
MAGVHAPDILIVDDHPLFRDALETAIGRAAEQAVTRHCGTLEEALSRVCEHSPDLLLLDLNLADASGFDGIVRLHALVPELAVAIVSASEGEEVYQRARTLGARAYLPKSLDIAALSQALSDILAGGDWFPEGAARAPDERDGDEAEKLASLTPAQRRVLDGLSAGLLNKQIAFEMGISEATVKAHMTAIFRKLGVNNRTQALLTLKSATAVDDYSAA